MPILGLCSGAFKMMVCFIVCSVQAWCLEFIWNEIDPVSNIIVDGNQYSENIILQQFITCFADSPSALLTIRNLMW